MTPNKPQGNRAFGNLLELLLKVRGFGSRAEYVRRVNELGGELSEAYFDQIVHGNTRTNRIRPIKLMWMSRALGLPDDYLSGLVDIESDALDQAIVEWLDVLRTQSTEKKLNNNETIGAH